MTELTKKELKKIEGGRMYLLEMWGYACGWMASHHAENCETAPGWTTRGGR